LLVEMAGVQGIPFRLPLGEEVHDLKGHSSAPIFPGVPISEARKISLPLNDANFGIKGTLASL
jgi:hypothetical protein